MSNEVAGAAGDRPAALLSQPARDEGRGIPRPVPRWGRFELALKGPAAGNPFIDISFGARFRCRHRTLDAAGFYDGGGVYRVRFMPDAEGEWTWETQSSTPELAGRTGAFSCTGPEPGRHGPVRVRNSYHFAYDDGTPYRPVGTTCYAWSHQPADRREETLETLKGAPFNKLRMCVFTKDYVYNRNEPELFPFERAGAGWDFTRFDPAFFRNLERGVEQLGELGIEADLILFHPYDRWGFAAMDAESDDRYLRYTARRLAAFANVWWSMANEFDLMKEKCEADWDRFFRIVQEEDPYRHLRSVHNCRGFYDHTKPWVTHQSIQHWVVENTGKWRRECPKPVVVDECGYEGDVEEPWGSLSAEELVHLFWEGFCRGGYVGHGETYLHPDEVIWW